METVEMPERRIRKLAVEREALHDAGATHDALEASRLALVEAEQRLSRALIALHAPEPGPAAA
jgi:hypothetical protein